MATVDWELEITGSPRDFDREEVALAVRTFMDPDAPYAIQALRSGRWEVVSPANLDHLLYVVGEFSDEKGVYFGMNPLRPGFVKPPTKGWVNPDVAHRRWVLVDVDSARPNRSETNATAAEKEAALDVINRIIEYLTSRGWPAPIVVDSGNGYHLYWRIDLPNDKLSQQLLAKLLKALAKRFDTPGADVDTGVHDAKRITKLPGTWARKGPHADERPHRKARIIHAPAVEVVSLDLLRREAGIKATLEVEPEADGRVADWILPVVNGDDGDAYARSAMEREVGKVATCTHNRQANLYQSALKLGNLVASGLLREDEVRAKLTAAAVSSGLGQDGDPEEIERAITNGLTAGKANPRTAPEKPTAIKASAKPMGSGKTVPMTTPDGTPINLLRRASSYETRPVNWLWPNWIPKGKLTTIAGGGGLGKSFVMIDLAARISVGGEIPFGGGECFELGNVIVINCEDDPEDTTVPRLIEAGADLDRVYILRSEVMGAFTLADVDMLLRAVAEIGEVALIIIDPATAFIGKADDHKNGELQSLLNPLRVAAWEIGAAIALITHVSKPGGNKVEAAARVIGGVAWVNAVRAALIFCRDPKDKNRRFVIPFKTNNGPEVGGLCYTIQPTDTLAHVQWEGVIDISADDAMSSSSQREAEKAKTEAEIDEFLKSFFKATLSVPSNIILDHAKENGISRNKSFAAKERLGVTAKRDKLENGEWCWFWIAPVEWMTVPGQEYQAP